MVVVSTFSPNLMDTPQSADSCIFKAPPDVHRFSLARRPSASAWPITARVATSSRRSIQILCKTSSVSKPNGVIDTQRQTRIDLVSVKFDGLVRTRRRFSYGFRIVSPLVICAAPAARAAASKFRLASLLGVTCEGPLTQMLPVKRILSSVNACFPVFVKEGAIVDAALRSTLRAFDFAPLPSARSNEQCPDSDGAVAQMHRWHCSRCLRGTH